MGRNYLAGQQGDALNAILAAAGYNFSLLLRWLKGFLLLLIALLQLRPKSVAAWGPDCSRSTTITVAL